VLFLPLLETGKSDTFQQSGKRKRRRTDVVLRVREIMKSRKWKLEETSVNTSHLLKKKGICKRLEWIA
jgi:hypothetical protein